MIQPDKNVLQEHAFYETGSLKLLLPLMNLQSYEVPNDDSSNYNNYGLIGLIVLVGVIGILLTRRRSIKKATSLV